jgi:hypothetical protein
MPLNKPGGYLKQSKKTGKEDEEVNSRNSTFQLRFLSLLESGFTPKPKNRLEAQS